jgi:hypothetical protein
LLEQPVKVILIDVTEQPIERPTRGQKEYYSGKKKKTTYNRHLSKINGYTIGLAAYRKLTMPAAIVHVLP